MKIFDDTLTKLQTSLDLRLERQNLLASNVANADTPGYVPRDFDFHQVMARAEQELALAQPEESQLIDSPAATSVTAPAQTLADRPGFDGNRVDADRAMVDLAENALQYGAGAQAATKKLAILLYTASDGTS